MVATFSSPYLILQHTLLDHVLEEEECRGSGNLKLVISRIKEVLVSLTGDDARSLVLVELPDMLHQGRLVGLHQRLEALLRGVKLQYLSLLSVHLKNNSLDNYKRIT